MRSQNHPIILFVDRNGFSVFQDTISNIARFNFTPDLVANLDIVNKEQFVNLIATFIQINKITPSSLAVILSDNVIYTKNFNDTDEVQNFLENVPFEDVLAKVVKSDQGNRIVAVNKDLVIAITDAFANKGSTIEAIIPGFMYGSNADFASGLNQNNIKIILNELEILKIGNLLTGQQEVIASQPPSEVKSDLARDEKKPQNLRQYILVGVFVTLLVILVVVYLNLGASR